MNYQNAIIALVILLILSVVWMFATSGDKKIFTGKMVGLALKTVAIATLFGALSLLYNRPVDWLNTSGLFLILLIAFGLFSWWYWNKQQLFDLDEKALFQWEFPQAFTIWSLATLVLLAVLWAKHLRYPGAAAGAMFIVAPASLSLLLPLFVVFAFRRWNLIPIKIDYREAWQLPVNQDAPVIEPSADALRVFFEIPVKEKSEDFVQFDVRVPRRTSLGQVFHHLLFQHNVQERSHRRIAIAYENKSDYVYGWLLYRDRKKWWWRYREYLDMESPVRQTDLINGERIYAERVRVWENQIKQS